jgi:hypothetical protein
LKVHPAAVVGRGGALVHVDRLESLAVLERDPEVEERGRVVRPSVERVPKVAPASAGGSANDAGGRG